MSSREPFKNLFDRAAVEAIADLVAPHAPAFARRAFVEGVATDLPRLELFARVDRIARGLREHLPPDYGDALSVVRASLPPVEGWDAIAPGSLLFLPLLRFVGLYGLGDPDRSLEALRELTRRTSAEFDIRDYLRRHPERTFVRLREWARDPDPRVRRLVSEGTRPRLPWASRLVEFVRDPAPVLALLELLRDDPDEVVRRSVANNLNDIAKDHPALVLDTARRWSRGASPGTRRLLRHALRTLVKEGEPAALELLGFSTGAPVALTQLTLSARRVALGEPISFRFVLASDADAPVTLSVDYAVHHLRANGTLSPKVFKLARRTLAPGERGVFERSHAIRPVTVRRYYPGRHRVEVLVNGRVVGGRDFTLVVPEGKVRR